MADSQGSVDMPLVEIDLLEGRSEAEIDAISDAVREAMVALLGVPRRDRFQIITERRRVSVGRATDAKQAFYRRLAELLADRTAIRTENLAVVMVENQREYWSFGHRAASYLELPPDAWR
jgi:phenylpyruvate tautomerase PptA (4-oxalocrotonate tautomerase family)